MERFALFPTPVASFDLEAELAADGACNRELRERLVAESRSAPGVRRSNVGGWHSTPDLALRRERCYQELIQSIIDHVGLLMRELAEAARVPAQPPLRYGAHAWAMVMRDGDYAVVHEHGDAHWSSVYYVDAGDADEAAHPDSGQLALVDPRRAGHTLPGLDLLGTSFRIQPTGGQLVLFPGWLQHYVNPYRGARPRVTISCNVVVSAP